MDASWPVGNQEPKTSHGLLVKDRVTSLAGIAELGRSYGIEILNSHHDSFLTQALIIPADPKALGVAANYVDRFLQEVFAGQDFLNWRQFYNAECNRDDALVSLKYNSRLPSWWFNYLNLCAPGGDFPIPGNATGTEEVGMVEARVLGH